MEELTSSSRRQFLKLMGSALALTGLGLKPADIFAKPDIVKICILHTNDVHSRIDPFPMDGSRNAGQAGVARRAALIKKIRSEEEHVLLFDAGDIFQGTPYFNLYGGELELKLMSEMGYDAATLGNHDFDNGVEGFVKQMRHAGFPIICSNYNFNNTALQGKALPYKIFQKGSIKVGVFGLGIELEGLVEKKNYGETLYLDPIEQATRYATLLKEEMNCDLIICLSHLGYKYRDRKVSDQVLATNTKNIDLIIGGHTHTFMSQPEILLSADVKQVQIFQVGFAGINLGRVDFYFEKSKKKKQAIGTALNVRSEIEKA